MVCISGASECTGCMNCFDNTEKKLFCPSCGKRLDNDSKVYIDKGSTEVIGCDKCITMKYAEDMEDLFI
jgi:hypothetical protein